MSDWYANGLEDDIRPRMFAAADRGEAFALVTILAAEGGGPRGPGAQMVVTATDMGGFLSGGCIESDVAIHARLTLADHQPRRLVYGRGSPFVDTQLPCGGRLELLVEQIAPDDLVLAGLRLAAEARRPVVLVSDGHQRRLEDEGPVGPVGLRTYLPVQRLLVVGADPFALAIADQGLKQGWEVTLIRQYGPEEPPPLPVAYRREAADSALVALRPDRWTAVAIATHDSDLDHAALVVALKSEAGYVGVLGSRRRLPARLARLEEDGLSAEAVARLHAPIGLDIGARSPRDVAVAVIAEIIGAGR